MFLRWRFAEWNQRELSDMDGKPEGLASWRERIKRPTIVADETRVDHRHHRSGW
jgi:hypothetical protein